MITKDLGAVSAYAYAVEKGYTGTEAEYAELMASYATVAQQASQSAQTAIEKAQQASASATSASQSADTASASATSAQTAQQTATAKASEAQQSAQTATTKAQEASQSASESSQSAQTAVQAKQDAQTAKTASETAQASAESARDDAESARDTAQQYAESIAPQKLIGAYPTDTATGSIASFTDGAENIPMKSVKVRIEPVQDLHGQDAPYPAGGGKNLLETSFEDRTVYGITITRTQEGGIAIEGTPTRDYSFVVGTVTLLPGTYDFWGFVDSGGGGSTYQLVYTGENMQTAYIASASSRSRTIESETVVTATVFVYATAGAVNTLIKPMVTVSGTQVDSFSPYSNICPISGWDSVVVSHSGVNIWDEEWEVGAISKGVNIDGGRIRSKNYIPIVPDAKYYAKVPASYGYVWVSYYDSEKNYIGASNDNGVAITNSAEFTIPSNARYMRFSITGGTTYNHDISINYPSTDTDFHPYSGNSLPIPLGQTVYGGTLDVTSGELVVDMAMLTLNTANMDNNNNNYPGWRNSGARAFMGANINVSYNNQILNVGKSFAVNTTDNYDNLYLPKTQYNKTQDEWKALAMDVQVVVPLATPITITLTPTEIKSLLGDNNLWADTGDSTVTYRADTTLYINRKIAEAVSALS